MITLIFNPPERLTDHFQVATDVTPWSREYTKTRHGVTPDRERASFGIRGVLEPLTASARELEHATGLYLLAYDLPAPALYVGIAAEARSPEGILRRLRKHCIKAMGANIGGAGSTGGVHHPRRWSQFAVRRHACLGAADGQTDVRFTTARVSEGNGKAALEHFERLICSNTDGLLDQICDRLWGLGAGDVELLTSGTVGLRAQVEHRISLW